MEVRNYMEKMIRNILDRLIEEKPEYKDIEPYRDEVIAYSLNKAEPLYGTTDMGNAIIESKIVSASFRSKVTAIVMEAINKIRANPRK